MLLYGEFCDLHSVDATPLLFSIGVTHQNLLNRRLAVALHMCIALFVDERSAYLTEKVALLADCNTFLFVVLF